MIGRRLAVVGATVAAFLAVAVAPAGAQTGAAVQDCDTARVAYDKALTALDKRADELGISAAEKDRLRTSVEEKGRDGVIDDNESAELLSDPVVVRVQTQFRASDLDLIKRVAAASNALLRCDDGAGNVTTAPPTSTTAPETAAPETTTPPAATIAPETTTATTAPPAASTDLDCADFVDRAAAQAAYNADTSDPNRLDADGDGVACEASEGTPVGGIQTGLGGMADVLAA